MVSQNFVISANRSALLLILVPLVETESAENLTFVIEPADKKSEFDHRASVSSIKHHHVACFAEYKRLGVS